MLLCIDLWIHIFNERWRAHAVLEATIANTTVWQLQEWRIWSFLDFWCSYYQCMGNKWIDQWSYLRWPRLLDVFLKSGIDLQLTSTNLTIVQLNHRIGSPSNHWSLQKMVSSKQLRGNLSLVILNYRTFWSKYQGWKWLRPRRMLNSSRRSHLPYCGHRS